METLRKNNLVVGILCALCCEIIYGMSYIFTKQATKVTSGFALLGWRFLIAFVIMTFLVLLGIVKVNLKEKSLKPIFIVAVFSPGIYFIGETVGISYTTASESGILLACIPIASLVGSTVILREKPGKWQIVGIFITLMGVITTVIAVGASSSFSPTGYLFLFIAVISYALYSVFVERAKGYTGAEITYMMLVVGAIIFVISACIDGYGRSNIKELICLPFQKHRIPHCHLISGNRMFNFSVLFVQCSNIQDRSQSHGIVYRRCDSRFNLFREVVASRKTVFTSDHRSGDNIVWSVHCEH